MSFLRRLFYNPASSSREHCTEQREFSKRYLQSVWRAGSNLDSASAHHAVLRAWWVAGLILYDKLVAHPVVGPALARELRGPGDVVGFLNLIQASFFVPTRRHTQFLEWLAAHGLTLQDLYGFVSQRLGWPESVTSSLQALDSLFYQPPLDPIDVVLRGTYRRGTYFGAPEVSLSHVQEVYGQKMLILWAAGPKSNNPGTVPLIIDPPSFLFGLLSRAIGNPDAKTDMIFGVDCGIHVLDSYRVVLDCVADSRPWQAWEAIHYGEYQDIDQYR